MTTQLEDPPPDANDPTGVNARLAAQQREADEHLFLRYLELDPIEGPDAAAAAAQRTKAGIKQGRTPFTTTRRLDRSNEQGFGFSVLWTRPPRVERVDAGRAAERSGLLPGDYIVFVDRHNVVTLPESQVLTLIKSSGPTLILETFRRGQGSGDSKTFPTRARGSLTLSDAPCSPAVLKTGSLNRMTSSSIAADQTLTESVEWRAPTACSNNTAPTSAPSRRRPLLPQVAFTTESMTGLGSIASVAAGPGNPMDHLKALQAVVAREQHFAHCLQFGMERYVVPMASRTDIITPNEHKLLFQNCEDLLRLSEDILEQLMNEDGEIQMHHIANVYLSKLPTIISLYKSYCNGLKRADCVLVQKLKQQSGGFSKACTEPPVGRRKADITQFIHKPLEQFRELLRLLRTARAAVNPSHSSYKPLNALVTHLQTAYHEITASAGLMGPIGEGRPLLSVGDLESRLVFTRCKPFVLAKPGRQWIFGGDLCRVEGKTVRPFWALLFTDLLLFATVSRDRVLFITEDPVLISNVSETCFNIRKKPNEFRLGVGNGRSGSPTARCGPPGRTRTRSMVLRAPSPDLKAVWQSLLLRQICRVNSSTGTPLSSPLESPAPLCYSEVTLDSQHRQVTQRSLMGHKSRLSQAYSQRNLDGHEGKYHSVSFASTGAVYDSISKLSSISRQIEEYRTSAAIKSYEMLKEVPDEITEHPKLTKLKSNGVAETPDTPPPNVSPGQSSKNSQTFSSQFVSLSSLQDSPQKKRLGFTDTPSSPSAILTPSTADFLDTRRTFGPDSEDPELWDSDGLCHWESFEADLALIDLNLDPCFKNDVEENIYFRDDFFSRRSRSQPRHPKQSILDL